ncbi:type II toxin-antitoxin system mRNA interferase toxin, RelE/StbE family [Candidatus Uhrbacteria bacterium]|nr:type II toxin-antitoxin system mRNA interferase toxin, RelE/StbE family [Candidatus Uhrbacteria bacterium]
MMVRRLPRFDRSFKKLPQYVREDFFEKAKLFAVNPRDPRLHTHKLQGIHRGALSFYLVDGFRVIFRFTDSSMVDFIDVGPHDIY